MGVIEELKLIFVNKKILGRCYKIVESNLGNVHPIMTIITGIYPENLPQLISRLNNVIENGIQPQDENEIEDEEYFVIINNEFIEIHDADDGSLLNEFPINDFLELVSKWYEFRNTPPLPGVQI